jgi:hypothetical protein
VHSILPRLSHQSFSTTGEAYIAVGISSRPRAVALHRIDVFDSGQSVLAQNAPRAQKQPPGMPNTRKGLAEAVRRLAAQGAVGRSARQGSRAWSIPTIAPSAAPAPCCRPRPCGHGLEEGRPSLHRPCAGGGRDQPDHRNSAKITHYMFCYIRTSNTNDVCDWSGAARPRRLARNTPHFNDPREEDRLLSRIKRH